MGIMRKALDNGKKLAKASAKLLPKGKTGNVIKEPEEDVEEMEVEEEEVDEEPEDTEDFDEGRSGEEIIEENLKKEINFVVGAIVPYAKEVGYKVVDSNGQPIECDSYAQAILVSQAVKNEKRLQPK